MRIGLFLVALNLVVFLALVVTVVFEPRRPPPPCEDFRNYPIDNVPARCFQHFTTAERAEAGVP